jgi:two-component system, NtrC family, response regulator AtoC
MVKLDCHTGPNPGTEHSGRREASPASGASCLPFPAPGDELAGVLITESPLMRAAIEQARRVARSKAAVLVEGESGTGKELIARLIHQTSPRATAPFIRVNCAALSDGVVESELFGHEKGAFTGADQEHAGRFERAHRGTLLLDEIGEMPLKLQAKLLRVLEQEEFERVGGDRLFKVDVRIVATTNRNLERECSQGGFRRDLYYRLSGVELRLPPLRARPEDVPPLVRHFLARFGSEGSVAVVDIAPRGLELLQACSWPGNVRQLRNVIHRSCILATGKRIRAEDLPSLHEVSGTPSVPTGQTLAEIERHVILQTLREVGGNKTAAAQRLGVTARTLLNKLKRYRELDAA